MKTGVRALGVAESYTSSQSTLAGAVVRADGRLDGLAYDSCTVGGLDATDAVRSLLQSVLREDIAYVFIAGIAPAWYNMLDLHAIHDVASRPVVAVSFEASEGLEAPLQREFDGEALQSRLAIYEAQPRREAMTVNDETIYVRNVGIDTSRTRDVVREFTVDGGRPEPLRVARHAARAADRWRSDS